MTITKINLINQPEEAMQKQKRQFENGFEVINTVDALNDIKMILNGGKDPSISSGPEQDRVVSIVKSLLGNSDTVQWYSAETHSDDTEGASQIEVLESFPMNEMKTIYDSLYLDHGPHGYNIIDVGYDKNYCYFILSTNGSPLASALSDYYRVQTEYGIRDSYVA